MGATRTLSFLVSSFVTFSLLIFFFLFSSYFFSLSCFFPSQLATTCLSFYLAKNAPFDMSSNLMAFLYSIACNAFVSFEKEILNKSLESLRKNSFASNLLSKLIKTFSTTLLSINSLPSNWIWFITHGSLSNKSLINYVSFIFKDSNSLLRFKTSIYLVLSLLWNSSLSKSQAYFVISQFIILIPIWSNTTFCK